MLTVEQLEARRKGIGGSDAAAVAGISKWKTPLDIYLDKLGLSNNEQSINDAMHFGNILEPIVANEYERRTGKKCSIENKLLSHPKYSWMLANLDRRIDGENGILECKTSSPYGKEWGEEGSDEMPDEYLMQCAHYAAVCDVKTVDLAVLIGGQKFKIYTYQRNAKLEKDLIEIEHHFWHENVLKEIPPDAKNLGDITKLYSACDDSKVAIADDEIEGLIYQLESIAYRKKADETLKKELLTAVQAYMKDASSLVDGFGKPLATWKTQQRKAYSVAASSSRVFKLKDN